MIRHIVLLDLPGDYDKAALTHIMRGLSDLRDQIAGFTQFEHGPNRDFEGLSPNHAYGFICQFDSQAVAQTYLNNSMHQALGGRLVALCRGGKAGIKVIDLEVAE